MSGLFASITRLDGGQLALALQMPNLTAIVARARLDVVLAVFGQMARFVAFVASIGRLATLACPMARPIALETSRRRPATIRTIPIAKHTTTTTVATVVVITVTIAIASIAHTVLGALACKVTWLATLVTNVNLTHSSLSLSLSFF